MTSPTPCARYVCRRAAICQQNPVSTPHNSCRSLTHTGVAHCRRSGNGGQGAPRERRARKHAVCHRGGAAGFGVRGAAKRVLGAPPEGAVRKRHRPLRLVGHASLYRRPVACALMCVRARVASRSPWCCGSAGAFLLLFVLLVSSLNPRNGAVASQAINQCPGRFVDRPHRSLHGALHAVAAVAALPH